VKVDLRSRGSRSSEGVCTEVTVDIGYGGAFYAIVDDRQLGLDVRTAATADVVHAAHAVTGRLRNKPSVTLYVIDCTIFY